MDGSDLISSLDAMFLVLEEGGMHMHVPVLLIFEAAPLRDGAGSLDVARIRRFIGEAIDAVPHFRQRLAQVPVLGSPIWIDDDRFELEQHVRHRRLDPPGDEAALKALVGAIAGERLDRSRALWETTIIDGLAGDRFAILLKFHHVVLDGRAGVEALAAFFGVHHEPRRRRSLGSPTGLRTLDDIRLVAHELFHRAVAGRELVGWLADSVRRRGLRALGDLAGGLRDLARTAVRPASPTPLNPPRVSPRRQVDWCTFELRQARARKRGGATVNDVLLACATGMVRSYLRAHGLAPDELDIRATVPVAVDRVDGRTNAVVSVIAPLPVGAAEPGERLARVAATMRALKGSRQSDAMDLIARVSDVVSHRLLAEGLKAGIRRRPASLVVSNTVGPPVPLYILGARLLEVYPFVPLNDTQALTLAFISYDGRLFSAFNTDPEAVADLSALRDALAAAFAELPEADA